MGKKEDIFFRDSKAAFDNAIDQDQLSETKGNFRYAGSYMYMHSKNLSNGKVIDVFKNINTRKYDVECEVAQ